MTPLDLNLADGLRLLGQTHHQLWSRYIAIGGDSTPDELLAHLTTTRCIDPADHVVIAQALNEAFLELGHDHPVSYSHRTL